jgi:hypothetical protein
MSAAETGPSADVARSARASLGEVLLSLVGFAFSFDREGVRDRLLRAIQHTYAVTQSAIHAVAHLVGLQESAALAIEVHALLREAAPLDDEAGRRALATLDATAKALTGAREIVAAVHIRHREDLVRGGVADVAAIPVRPFVASRSVPALHAFARPPLLPPVRVGENPEKPPPEAAPPKVDLEQAIALANQIAGGGTPVLPEPEGGQSAAPAAQDLWAYEPAIEEVEMLRRLARDCLEDLANHRTLRKPNPIETWLDQGPFEDRILEILDAFVALGAPAVPAIPLFLAEVDGDAERAFAAAFALGCIEGNDTLVAAVCIAHESVPETHEGLAEGLALASNPAIKAALIDLAGARRPGLAALALDVLHLRGERADDVLPLVSGRAEPEVAWRVARALAGTTDEAAAVGALHRLLRSPDDAVFGAAAESLLVRGDPTALEALREAALARTEKGARGPRADLAAELLAWGGSSSDAELVTRAAIESPSARLMRAMGRAGHAAALDVLVSFLEHEDEEVVGAAASALERITGAGLLETVEEPWELSLPPIARDFGPVPTPMRKVARVRRDPSVWRAHLDEHGERLALGRKWRAGKPFTPALIVEEIASPRTPPEARAEALRELSIVRRSASSFRHDTWVSRQQDELPGLMEAAAASRYGAGTFPGRGQAPTPGSAGPEEPERVQAPMLADSAGDKPLPTFMRGAAPVATPPPATAPAPVPVAPAPVAPAHKPNPTPEPKRGLRSGGTMMGIVLPILPATPFQSGAAGKGAAPAPGSPGHAAAPGADETIDASDDEGPSQRDADAHATAGAQPSPLARSALPFRSAGPAAPPRVPAAPAGRAAPEGAGPSRGSPAELTLDQYAAMCAALGVFPERAEAIFARHGLSDPRRRAAADAAWKARLARYPSERAEWERRYWQWEASWRRSGWR